jgi:hypothetical protein
VPTYTFTFTGTGSEATEVCRLNAPCTSVNAAVWHPYHNLLASCTGGRTFEFPPDFDQEDSGSDEGISRGKKRGVTDEGIERPNGNGLCESDQNGQQPLNDGADWVNGIYIWQQVVDADNS